jgi:hypothetical protein
VNGAQYRRLIEAEAAVARLSAGGPASYAAGLVARDPASLTDAQAAEAWRMLCQRPPGAPPVRSVRLDEDEHEAIIRAWKELTER